MSAAAERDDLTTVLESLRLGPGTGFADAISSSLRDYKAGQPTELEWLSGHAEREASRVGVSTPALSEMMRQVRMLESHRNRDKISLSAIREA